MVPVKSTFICAWMAYEPCVKLWSCNHGMVVIFIMIIKQLFIGYTLWDYLRGVGCMWLFSATR